MPAAAFGDQATEQQTADSSQVPKIRIEAPPDGDEDAIVAATVIERAEMDGALRDVADVLDEQPGLRISRLGGLGSFTSLSVRGSTPEQVLIFVDGIPLNTAQGGGVNLASLPLGPIERMTIYRGVAPLGFASSAMGGVVQIETRRLTKPATEIELGGGSFGAREVKGFVGQRYKGWGWGAAVDYQGSEGNFRFKNDRGTLLTATEADDLWTQRANNAFNQGSLMLKAGGALGEHGHWRLLDLVTWRQLGLAGIGLYPTQSAALTAVRHLLGLRLALKRLWGKPVDLSVVPYSTFFHSRLEDPLGEIGLRQDNTRDNTLTAGLNATVRLPGWLGSSQDGRYTLTPSLAAEYRYEQFSPDSLAGAVGSNRHRFNTATELALTLEPWGAEVVGTARYEGLRSEGLDAGAAGDVNGDAWTGRLAVTARPHPTLSLSFSGSRSVRFPNLFELFGNNGAVVGNPLLVPESGLNLEVALGFRPYGGSGGAQFELEAVGFFNRVDGLIQFVQNAQSVSVAQNIDRARLMGVELGARLEALGAIRLRGSFTWLDSRNESTIAARQGKGLPNRPRFKAFGRLELYQRQLLGTDRVGITTELEFLDGNFLDFANLVAVDPRMIVGAGLYAEFGGQTWRLAVDARNLTGSTIQDLSGFPLPGLSVLGSLRWRPQL